MYDINMRCVFKVTRGETTKRGSLHNLYLMFNALKTEIKDFSKKKQQRIFTFFQTRQCRKVHCYIYRNKKIKIKLVKQAHCEIQH